MDACTLAAKCAAEAIEENHGAIAKSEFECEASLTEDEHLSATQESRMNQPLLSSLRESPSAATRSSQARHQRGQNEQPDGDHREGAA
jgi:hypothetical protein